MNNYQFYNLISKEKFNSLNTKEKECFLLEKKIFLNNNWDYAKDQIKESSKKNEIDFYVNDNLKRELVKIYIENTDYYWDTDSVLKRIKFELLNAIDNNDKREFLRKKYKFYLKIIRDDDLIIWRFYKSNNDFYKNDFLEAEILSTEDIPLCMSFVFGEYLNFNNNSIFNSWSNLVKSDKILNFLKKELNKITSSKEEKVYKPKPTTPLPFNYEIFRTSEAQDWFFDTLNKMGALEEDDTPKKRKFQPICHAIFYSLDCKKKIFRYNLELKDFILFLNDEFNTNINSKLSIGYRHVDEVEELLFNAILQ